MRPVWRYACPVGVTQCSLSHRVSRATLRRGTDKPTSERKSRVCYSAYCARVCVRTCVFLSRASSLLAVYFIISVCKTCTRSSLSCCVCALSLDYSLAKPQPSKGVGEQARQPAAAAQLRRRTHVLRSNG